MKHVVFCFCLILSACSLTMPAQNANPDVSLRVLALGDSYTVGTGVEEFESYPFQLSSRLKDQGVNVEQLDVIARNGWTTDELLAGIKDTEPQEPYDLVTLLIGVNNQFRMYEVDQYRVEFRELLVLAIELAGDDPSRVIVLSIPDWGATPFAYGWDVARIGEEINAYNEINKAIADELGTGYVDITDISRQAANDNSLLASDNLHPSGKMYAQWVEKILQVLPAWE